MEVRTTPGTPWTGVDWKLLGLLAVVAVGVRGWQLTHTEVPARDTIGFIRIAWQLREAPLTDWSAVVSGAYQHPLYPISVVAVSAVVEPAFAGPATELMQWSAQLATALAAVVLVVPTFLLGRELFDRRVGFWSALLLQLVPVTGRILADGMSEGLFLAFATSALLWGVRALRPSGGAGAFALCGLFGGLAYLTRPEGALIVAATGAVLVAGQFVRLWRRSATRFVLGGAALTGAALAVAGPFVAATGGLTVKPSGKIIMNAAVREKVPAGGSSALASRGPLLAVYEVYDKTASDRFWWGFGALFTQIVKGSFYVGWAAALFGLWIHRERSRREPGAWMMLLVSLGVACALWRVVVLVGYLSDRHALLILACGGPWAAAGMIALGEGFGRQFPRLSVPWPAARAAAVPLVVALAAAPNVFETLHEHRRGFRQAGVWLGANAAPVDTITDPFCWSHYYAGRLFLEGRQVDPPPGYKPREYIVIDEERNAHPRLPLYQETKKRAERDGKLVYEWTGRRGGRRSEVKVYMVQK